MRDVNLIPSQRVQNKRRKARLRLWASIMAVYFASMALCLSSAYAMWNQDEEAASKLNHTIDRVGKYSHTIIELKKLLAQTRSALQTTWAIHGQPDWSQLLQIISAELGDQVVLDHCELSSLNANGYKLDVTVPEKLTADDLLGERQYALRLSGLACEQNAVSQFVLRLEGLQLFDSVRLEKSRRQTFMEQPAVAFTIECRF